MNRKYYHNLAMQGLKMPIGTDLTLHEEKNPESIILDGIALGKVVEKTALKYKTPLAIPLMDLKIEKQAILSLFDIHANNIETYHFKDGEPDDSCYKKYIDNIKDKITPRMKATCEAVNYISENTELLPIGMCIGPFSLMTKLVTDPITAVYLYGTGIKPENDPAVFTLKKALDISISFIKNYILKQISAGAKAIVVCEPAANKIYISPMQIKTKPEIWDQTVIDYNLEITKILKENNCDLIFHNCGELTNEMLVSFNQLNPVMLSLGCSRILWEDADLISKDIVLFGNLPSKHFYSDEITPKNKITEITRELIKKMEEKNHPFILGSECDILSVKEYNQKINEKIDTFLNCCSEETALK